MRYRPSRQWSILPLPVRWIFPRIGELSICRITISGVSINQRCQASVTLQPDWYPFNSLSAGVVNNQKYKTDKVLDLPHSILYKSLVRTYLDFASSVWSPFKIKHIEQIESVQRRATKQLPGMKNKSYPKCLRKLKLPTLSYRRLCGDMIEVYKMVNGLYNSEVGNILNMWHEETERTDLVKARWRPWRIEICVDLCGIHVGRIQNTTRYISICQIESL